MRLPCSYDVLVVGGGHAGCEAAAAAARMGAKTLLLTHSIETIGQMSCNPSIGGIGKSHLVREIDALDGLMAIAADKAAIHARVLNARKGPAVQATRVQCDRSLYKKAIRQMIESQANLSLFQQAVDDLIIENHRVYGVITQSGLQIKAQAVVLTTGTFLAGLIHIGHSNYAAGRAGDPAAINLARQLRRLPFRIGRLKTGTPPRIAKNTIDFSPLGEQPGDEPMPYLSQFKTGERAPQVSCFITHTNLSTHEIIKAHLNESPMYSGIIEGRGPRYCPSIEDKIVRFSEKNSHQIFLEPEGLEVNEIYPAGLSTSLPYHAQIALVRSMKGLENAHITRPGYAIEYDYVDPREVYPWLETKNIQHLFLAGQINGTTGYEEAAAQGLLAGMNAALKVAGKATWYPRRDEAYLGVLVDDLVNIGTDEPYRMFTSRAEHRLLLREDNADDRLTKTGYHLGVVSQARYQAWEAKNQAVVEASALLANTLIKPDTHEAAKLADLAGLQLEQAVSATDLLKRPEISYSVLEQALGEKLQSITAPIGNRVAIQQKYAGYIKRQQQEIEGLRNYEDRLIPLDLDFNRVKGLSNEVKEKLSAARPVTIGQASRISGVTPAAVSLLLVYVKKNKIKT